MKKDNPEIDAAARRIVLEKKAGESITLNAAMAASDQMASLMDKFGTPSQKSAALEYHALYLGIGTMFMEAVAPQADTMIDEIKEEHRKHGSELSDQAARVLTGLWLAKIFMEIQKSVEKYEAEHE